MGKTKASSSPTARKSRSRDTTGFTFHPAKVDSLFVALDAVAWIDAPDAGQIAQFGGIDPRTAGKLLSNAITLGLLDKIGDRQYRLALPYPYKGSVEQKKAVVREALVRLPLMVNVRQFVRLGDSLEAATRKAATVVGIRGYQPKDFATLIEWANNLGALQPNIIVEDLLDEATAAKEHRHVTAADKVIAFLSHSSKDKPFVRQLAADLNGASVGVWLDEQRIKVGDSIPDQIALGLAESDYFLIAISQHSVASSWVQKELSGALVREIERRKVTVLPLKLDDTEMPESLKDKKYADFSRSYKAGLEELLEALKGRTNG